MSTIRSHLVALALLVGDTALAQRPARTPPTPLTETLLLAQRPENIPLEQWKVLIQEPTTAALYPIRLTRAILDTLDVKQLDIRYHYIMVQRASEGSAVLKQESTK